MNRRWYRSRTDTVLGGVASGLADYLNADPALVRIAWAILTPLTGGIAFLAYIVGWVVIPENPEDAGSGAVVGAPSADGEVVPAASVPARPRSSGNAGVLVGLGLIAIGVWFLLREYMPRIDWSLIWPVIVVGIGVLILVGATRRRG